MIRFVARKREELRNCFSYLREDGKYDEDILKAAKFDSMNDLYEFFSKNRLSIKDCKIDEAVFAVITEEMNDIFDGQKEAFDLRPILH